MCVGYSDKCVYQEGYLNPQKDRGGGQQPKSNEEHIRSRVFSEE